MFRSFSSRFSRFCGLPRSRSSHRISAKTGAVLETKSKPSGVLIFLHGLGDQGVGWTEPLAMIQPSHVRIICPDAPSIPVTLNGGMVMPAWYDIYELGNQERQDVDRINASSKRLAEWVDAECTAHKIESRRVVIGGFSQGGAVSLNTILSYPKPLGGAIILSSYLPQHETHLRNRDAVARINQHMPILVCHGRMDDVVPFMFGQASVQFLEQLGFTNVRFRAYDDLYHAANMQELNDVRSFLTEALPANSRHE